MSENNTWEDVVVSDEVAQILSEIGADYSYLEGSYNKTFGVTQIVIARMTGERMVSLKFGVSDAEIAALPLSLLKEKIEHVLDKHNWRKNDRS